MRNLGWFWGVNSTGWEQPWSPVPRGAVDSPGGGGVFVYEREHAGGGPQIGGGSQVVEGFVGDDKEFEVDALRDWEPVEVMKDGSDVVAGTGVCGETSSRILDILWLLECFG